MALLGADYGSDSDSDADPAPAVNDSGDVQHGVAMPSDAGGHDAYPEAGPAMPPDGYGAAMPSDGYDAYPETEPVEETGLTAEEEQVS